MGEKAALRRGVYCSKPQNQRAPLTSAYFLRGGAAGMPGEGFAKGGASIIYSGRWFVFEIQMTVNVQDYLFVSPHFE